VIATTNCVIERGEAKMVTTERAQTSSRKETETSWETRKKRFHRIEARGGLVEDEELGVVEQRPEGGAESRATGCIGMLGSSAEG